MRERFVYVVQHAYCSPAGVDEVKLIGVFSSRALAQAAVAKLKTQPGFVAHPDGFHIGRHGLNRTQWTDGFVTL